MRSDESREREREEDEQKFQEINPDLVRNIELQSDTDILRNLAYSRVEPEDYGKFNIGNVGEKEEKQKDKVT